jgi:flagellar basal body-associated protein FliL
MAGNRTSLISESGFDSFKGKASAAMGGRSIDKDKAIKVGLAVVMLVLAAGIAMYQLGFFEGKSPKSAKVQPVTADQQKAADEQHQQQIELETKTGVKPQGA